MSMSSDAAELSSLRSQLDELTRRIVGVGDTYRESDDSAITAELDQAERSMLAAQRSVDRAIDRLTS
jgi:hypothetical protein